jgi:hypothetical protein
MSVPTIPRTPNGKLDYRALPTPESAATPHTVLTAGTELERAIAGVWREVLRVGHIGTDDNFFDLGGNSLLLAKARSRLAETLDREVAAVTLFTFPTVRALARHFEGDKDSTASTASAATGRDLARGRRALLAHSARRTGAQTGGDGR